MIHLCTQCGVANSGKSAKCYACAACLEEQHHSCVQSPETSRFDEFATRAQAYQSGEISRAEFGSWLESTLSVMEQKREDYREVIMQGEFKDLVLDLRKVRASSSLKSARYIRTAYLDQREAEVATAYEGMIQMEEAAIKMLEFCYDERMNDSVLVDALGQMWNGNLLCNEAIRMNREFRESLSR